MSPFYLFRGGGVAERGQCHLFYRFFLLRGSPNWPSVLFMCLAKLVNCFFFQGSINFWKWFFSQAILNCSQHGMVLKEWSDVLKEWDVIEKAPWTSFLSWPCWARSVLQSLLGLVSCLRQRGWSQTWTLPTSQLSPRPGHQTKLNNVDGGNLDDGDVDGDEG